MWKKEKEKKKNRGGRPLIVLISYGPCGIKATFEEEGWRSLAAWFFFSSLVSMQSCAVRALSFRFVSFSSLSLCVFESVFC